MLPVALGETGIHVRVQDYAQVSPATMTKAQALASAVLQQAGVNLVWAHCSLQATVRDELCRHPLGPADLQVRILDREMAKRVRASRRSTGYAMLPGQFPSISAVFYRRAVELEATNFARRAKILGIMMAHDIGHLLLAENSHSEQGILRARWSDQDLKLIAQGRLWFTPAEVARIADNNSRRRFWENVADPAILRIAGWEDAGPARQRSF